MSIYVRDAGGNRHKIAGVGLPGPAGKSAYQYAVEGGFSGTEEEFRAVVGIRNNDNLLDNWYLADPINQRGQTEYTGAGYTIDRWLKWSEGSLEVVSGGIKLHANNSTVVFSQICGENTAELVGQTATLSILFEDVKGTFVIQVVDSFDLAVSSNGLHSVTGTLSLSTVNIPEIRIFSSNEGENSCIIKAIKLEFGPVQTLAHKEGDTWVLNDPPPAPALELVKCQRYYEAGIIIIELTGEHDAKYERTIPFKVTKRINPRCTVRSMQGTPDHISYYSNDGWTDIPISTQTLSTNQFGVRVSCPNMPFSPCNVGFLVEANSDL